MPDNPLGANHLDGERVVGTVDGDGDDASFVLADVTRDEAWLSIGVSESAVLSAWR